MIEKDEICELIPHAGEMCLIDQVNRWDDKTIQCESNSHLKPDNPLLRSKVLSAINLVEYGAQAMAVHGGLMARANGRKLGNGYLAALRDVQFIDQDIRLLPNKLTIEAECIMANGGNMIYQFRISSDNMCIISGRATVVEVAS